MKDPLTNLHDRLQFITNYYKHEQKFTITKSRWCIFLWFYKAQIGSNLFFTDEHKIGFYFYNEKSDIPGLLLQTPKLQTIFSKMLLKCV